MNAFVVYLINETVLVILHPQSPFHRFTCTHHAEHWFNSDNPSATHSLHPKGWVLLYLYR